MITAFLGIWWAWIAAAIVFGLIEIFTPAFIFLGFAIGALITGLIVAATGGMQTGTVLVVFGILSLVAWVGLRFAFRRQSSAAKIITHDINDL